MARGKARGPSGRRIGIGAAVAVVLLGAAALLFWHGDEPGGIDALWAALAGPADERAFGFETAVRRESPNDALACPAGLCAGAKVDLVAPVFAVPAERLRAIVAEVATAEPGTALIPTDAESHDRYLVRTRILRFPDLVDVRIIPRGENESTLALYSRSRIGHWDFGVNRARLERWLGRIGEVAAEAPAVTEG